MSSNITHNQHLAIESLSRLKFHQSFTVPATYEHGPLKVTFSIAGPLPDEEEVPTILFCGGVFRTRWIAVSWDYLAREMGVRVLCLDRPGLGGSTPVPIQQRIPVFLETVPLLLKYLHIPHIHLGSHSAGKIYALNILCHYPHLLSPTFPSMSLFAPWIHQTHTQIPYLRATSLLSNNIFNSCNSLTGFAAKKRLPKLTSLTSIFTPRSTPQISKEKREELCQQGFGHSVAQQKEIASLTKKYSWAEEANGGNEDIRLCLKSPNNQACNWGLCEDYNSMVDFLREGWGAKIRRGAERLRVSVFFAEKDWLVNGKGRKYLIDTFERLVGPGVEVEFWHVPGASHDGVLNWKCVRATFALVRGQEIEWE